MKKKIISLLTICCLFGMVACTKEIKQNKDIDLNKLEGKIEVWTSSNSLGNIESYIGKFREVNNKVTINNTQINEIEFGSKISEVLESGKDMPDIIIASETAVSELRKHNLNFMDLNEDANALKDKAIRDKSSQVIVEDKVIAIPWYVSPRAMFYRKDVFEEAGIKVEDIKTWTEYIEAGKKVLERTGGKMKMLPINKSKDSSFFNQLLNQLNGSYYNKEGKVKLDTEEAIKAMMVIKSINDSNISYSVSSEDEIMDALRKNEIASMPYGTQVISIMREKLQEQSGKWAIMNMPAFEPGGGIASAVTYTYISINKSSSKNKAVMEFKAFLQNNKELEKESIINRGIFPVTSQLYNEPFMDEKDKYYNNDKIWRYLVNIAREAPGLALGDTYAKVKTEVVKAQENILIKKQDIKSALEDINKQFNGTANSK